MDQVTFTARFTTNVPSKEVDLPQTDEPLEKRVACNIKQEWETVRPTNHILFSATVKNNTIKYEYIAPHSIHEGEDKGNIIWECSYGVRNEMLYEVRYGFCEDWVKGLVATFYLPVGSLVRKVFVPLIFSIPCLRNQLSERWQKKISREMETNLPLKALAGFIGELCLSILWIITLGLLSPWINFYRGDIERWENGHINQVDKQSKWQRAEEMPYLMPWRQPITTYNFRDAHPQADAKIDLMTTQCIPEGHKIMMARHMRNMEVREDSNIEISINAKEVPEKQLFPSKCNIL